VSKYVVILFTLNKRNSLLYLLNDWRRNVVPTACLKKRKSKIRGLEL